MKDNYGIKKLYEGAGRRYGGGGRICLWFETKTQRQKLIKNLKKFEEGLFSILLTHS